MLQNTGDFRRRSLLVCWSLVAPVKFCGPRIAALAVFAYAPASFARLLRNVGHIPADEISLRSADRFS
jgi:hypothetical protein